MLSVRQVLTCIGHSHNTCDFEKIVGHTDIKLILRKAILAKKPVHVLLVGSPGSAKTMFLTEIMKNLKQTCFIIGSNTTKAGLLNQLFEKRPKFLLIDELDKMNIVDQTSLLNLMESGLLSETKVGKTRQVELVSWVFGTANSCEKITQPLLSRFLVLEIPEYNFEDFTNIAASILSKEKFDEKIARVIAEKVWYELGSTDIRDVIKVARLTSSIEEISILIKILNGKNKSSS